MSPEKNRAFEMPEATKPLEPEFNEVHNQGYLEMDEERIKPTRQEICDEFKIPETARFTRAVKSGYKRKITSFLITLFIVEEPTIKGFFERSLTITSKFFPIPSSRKFKFKSPGENLFS